MRGCTDAAKQLRQACTSRQLAVPIARQSSIKAIWLRPACLSRNQRLQCHAALHADAAETANEAEQPAIVSSPAAQEDEAGRSVPVTTATLPRSGKLWGSSHHVITVGVEEADQLYVSLNERTNEQHVLMVLYAPWCPYCQAIEPEVERLAAGLKHEPSISVVALNVDDKRAKYFAKEVLGVQALPNFVLFPRGSRAFFRYKGHGRDSESLLRFLNMVCNQNTDTTWRLKTGARAASQASAPQPPPSPAALAAIADQRTAVVTAAGEPASVYSGAEKAAALAGSIAFAAVAALVLGRVMSGKKQEAVEHDDNWAKTAAGTGTGGGSASASSGAPASLTPTTAPGEAPAAVPATKQKLLVEIDNVLSRMSMLMVRLVGARVGLSVPTPPAPSPPATAPAAALQASSSSTTSGTSAAATVAAAAAVAPTVLPQAATTSPAHAPQAATTTSTQPAPSHPPPSRSPSPPPVDLAALAAMQQQELSLLSGPDAARSSPMPGQGSEALVTGEAVRLTKELKAEDWMNLLDQAGGDVQNLVNRMLQAEGGSQLLHVDQVPPPSKQQ